MLALTCLTKVSEQSTHSLYLVKNQVIVEVFEMFPRGNDTMTTFTGYHRTP